MGTHIFMVEKEKNINTFLVDKSALSGVIGIYRGVHSQICSPLNCLCFVDTHFN